MMVVSHHFLALGRVVQTINWERQWSNYLYIQQLVWGGKNTAVQTSSKVLRLTRCQIFVAILVQSLEGLDGINLHTVKQLFVTLFSCLVAYSSPFCLWISSGQQHFIQNGTTWQFSARLCWGLDCQRNMHTPPVDHDLLFWANSPCEFCVLPSELKWNRRCLTSSHLTSAVRMLFVSSAHSAHTVGYEVLRNQFPVCQFPHVVQVGNLNFLYGSTRSSAVFWKGHICMESHGCDYSYLVSFLTHSE